MDNWILIGMNIDGNFQQFTFEPSLQERGPVKSTKISNGQVLGPTLLVLSRQKAKELQEILYIFVQYSWRQVNSEGKWYMWYSNNQKLTYYIKCSFISLAQSVNSSIHPIRSFPRIRLAQRTHQKTTPPGWQCHWSQNPGGILGPVNQIIQQLPSGYD